MWANVAHRASMIKFKLIRKVNTPNFRITVFTSIVISLSFKFSSPIISLLLKFLQIELWDLISLHLFIFT